MFSSLDNITNVQYIMEVNLRCEESNWKLTNENLFQIDKKIDKFGQVVHKIVRSRYTHCKYFMVKASDKNKNKQSCKHFR